MNKNDQWFSPGDKVMRVAYADTLGLDVFAPNGQPSTLIPDTDFGKVLCVRRCWKCGTTNSVSFIGIREFSGNGFYACCFRKVEEIKLCVRAAEKFKQPEEQPVQP